MNKLETLKKFIEKYDSALIAFSGGVDSTFLAKAATDVLGRKALCVTAVSCTYPASESEEAGRLAASLGLRHMIVDCDETEIPGFSENGPDRCYLCKKTLFSALASLAAREGLSAVFEGSTVDDLNDFRPGRKAIRELSIISPLLETGLSKDDIRACSRRLHLETASKPSFACLASRFPYGETITRDKLTRVGKAEENIKKLGFTQFRVRSHGNLARIEVGSDEIGKAWCMRERIDRICRDAGYTFTSLDLRGYRTGAMNEALSPEQKSSLI